MNVVVNGLMTNYQKVGSGSKLLVFLHGWGDNSATFSKLVSLLQADYTLLLLDLPGFGTTQAPPEPWGTGDYVNFINAWLKKINAEPVYAIVAHSFGGAVAITGLGNGGLKAKKLILVATAGIRNKGSTKKLSLAVVSKIIRLPLFLLPQNRRQNLRAKAYKILGSDLMLIGEMEPTFRRIIKEDVRASAAKLKLPTLLIYGTKDEQTPLKDGQILNSLIAGSKLEVIKGAAHFVQQEQPEVLARMIKEFLGGQK